MPVVGGKKGGSLQLIHAVVYATLVLEAHLYLVFAGVILHPCLRAEQANQWLGQNNVLNGVHRITPIVYFSEAKLAKLYAISRDTGTPSGYE